MKERAAYVRSVLGPREPVLDAVLRRSLLDQDMPTIMVDDDAGRVLQMLTRLHRPQRVIEIGTLFGYSTIHLARGLPPGGRVTTVEADPEAAALARENFEIAEVSDVVEVIVGDAVEYLASVPAESVGMVFIDADKASYPTYLKHGYLALQKGGLLIADDAYADGDFSAESASEGRRERDAITVYNRAVTKSPNLFSTFITTGTGFMVSYKEK